MKQTKVEKHIALTPLFKIPQSKREQKNLNWNFRAVCSQKNKMRTSEHDATLKCRIQHHSNPFLRLCPYKLEELNQEPIVIVFHDFISIKDCDEIISHASPNMRLSTTGSSGSSGKNLKTRTSKQAWVNDQTFIPKFNST